MKTLSERTLGLAEREALEALQNAPVTILQIGEGNFLRGFVDWMIQSCRAQGLYAGSIAVTQPRPEGKAKIDQLARQDGLYTLVTQGLENGAPVSRKETIQVFSHVFDPYSEWARLRDIAVSADLQVVVSNTTEAGIVYRPEELTDGPILSYPGKLAFLLHERFQAFQGAPDKGLVLLPCELLERNGDALKQVVLRYAEDWNFPEAFKTWVAEHNRFLNSLVDRIVTGYPEEARAEAWFAEWGYRDAMLCTAEPYHLWAIEAEPEMEALLPLRKAGLNVHWTDDLKPYQQRKVRILNGAHTWMSPIGILHGVEHVRELLEHPVLGAEVRRTVLEEIVPSLPYDAEELRGYAASVFDRFGNPYIRHRLADIAMNSISKFNARLLPSIRSYGESGKLVPIGLALSLAGLLRYYKIEKQADGTYAGTSLEGLPYAVRDDARVLERLAGHWVRQSSEQRELGDVVSGLLADAELWGTDMSVWQDLNQSVTREIERMERGGRDV
ncbi:tagaturonate reductase [Paenibacillus methanolicus]|uniref:Tagaturonate reductase n=1 Tax=Paenibacillus methanolicus TaxID=582686 RepID=A0A5S5CCW7_9BACL|nr:tagaturonate reductase [Paenibacillus methanolicus]TYP76352.1 tagaturonate reductase [Paenibacillus methanolicus]